MLFKKSIFINYSRQIKQLCPSSIDLKSILSKKPASGRPKDGLLIFNFKQNGKLTVFALLPPSLPNTLYTALESPDKSPLLLPNPGHWRHWLRDGPHHGVFLQ